MPRTMGKKKNENTEGTPQQVAYADIQEYGQAERWFKKLISKNPKADRAYLNLAILYGIEMKDLSRAQP